MKTPFLLCWLCPLWLNIQKPASTTKPLWAKIYNNRLLDLMTAELTPKNLQAVYKGDFRIGKISRNKYEPNVRDTLLVVNTSADKVSVFKNR